MQFTVKLNESGYGYTAATGTICIVSGDPALKRSIQAGKWYDSRYSLTNSIFTPFLCSTSVNANEAFQKIVAIGIEFASLSSFAEYIRIQIWSLIFKGAMYAKYNSGKGVAPCFLNSCPYDLNDVFRKSNIVGKDGLLSTIATPNVDLFSELVDISSISLEAPDIVKNFTVFSNALQIEEVGNTTVSIPGSSTSTFISYIISMQSSSSTRPPTLHLSKSAFAGVKTRLICSKFYGGLHVTNDSDDDSLVIVNGLLFEIFSGEVSITTDIRTLLPGAVLRKYTTDLEFALVAAEARLNFLLSSSTENSQGSDWITMMQEYLIWLGDIAGTDSANASLQAQALYLAKIATSYQGYGVPIPFLVYDAYKDTISNVEKALSTVTMKIANFVNRIEMRKAEERTINVTEKLNENVISSGKLLVEYIKAQADFQEDINNQLESVIQRKEAQVQALGEQAKKYSSNLEEQRLKVNEQIEAYQEAVVEWQTNEEIKSVLEIASNLFSLGFSFIIPSSTLTALKDLGKTVQCIQKTVIIFNAAIKTYNSFKSFPSNPQKLVDVLQGIRPGDFNLPTALEWDEMKVNMDLTLNNGPDVAAKKILSAAFSVLVLRGKALLEVQNELQRKLSELSADGSRLRLHAKQKYRLSQLSAVLDAEPKNLDINTVDLVGSIGRLLCFERPMLLTMASTVTIQDRALQYEYLQPPTPINGFSLLDLQLAIVLQSQSITRGLTVQPYPKLQHDPIIYEIHGVNPRSLINSNSYRFTIPLNSREFSSYNYVRVQDICVEIGGITSTDSGKYYTELLFNGKPFFDRGFNGEPLTFQTVPRLYTSRNNISSSIHCFDEPAPDAYNKGKMFCMADTQGSFSDYISPITPFSSWSISLPLTYSNEGIKFDDSPSGVTIRLTFRIFAQLKENPVISRMEKTSQAFLLQKQGIQAEKPQKTGLAKMSYQRDGIASTVSTLDVLDLMENRTVCGGWDVVFSLTAKQVNDNLYDQYNDRVKCPKFMRSTGDYCYIYTSSEGVVMKTTFNLTFKAPRLQFLLNNSDSAQVYFPISFGKYEYSIKANGKWIVCDSVAVTEKDKFYVQGNVPLAFLQGDISTQHNISLKLNKGAFSALGFKSGSSDPVFNMALTNYFTSLKDGYELYTIGTLDTRNVTMLDSLTPKSFQFKVYHTPSDRDLIQIFIATSNPMPVATDISLMEPIPSSYNCSLIINSRIFFEYVLPVSIGDGGIDLEIQGNTPPLTPINDKVSFATVAAGSISGPFEPICVSEGSFTPPVPPGGITAITNYKNYVAVPNSKATVDIRGMKFVNGNASSGYNLLMNYKMKEKAYHFMYGSQLQTCSFKCSDWSKIKYTNHTLNVTVTMNATLEFTVSGKGQNQGIQMSPVKTTNPNIDSNVEPPAGACKKNDRELQIQFRDNLRKALKPHLETALSQTFNNISLFALKNILFPAENFVNLQNVFVPGDMVVFGTITRET